MTESNKDPAQSARDLIDAGWLDEERGDTEAAETAYRRAIQVAPADWHGHYMLGCLFSKQERFAEALDHFQLAVQRIPDHPAVLQAYGTALFALDDIEGAIRAFETAVKCDPDNPLLWTSLGRACTRFGDARRAEEAYRSVLRVNAREYDAFTGLAELLIDVGRFSEVESLAHDFIQHDPDRREAWGYLAAAWTSLRRYEVAKVLCTHLDERFTNWGYINYILGRSLKSSGKPAAAEAMFKRAITLDPGLAGAHYELGVLKFDRGAVANAGRHFLDAAGVDIRYAGGHSGLGFVFLRFGRLDEAAAAFRRAVAYDPFLGEAFSGLGQVQFIRQDAFGALFFFSKAIAKAPSLHRAHAGLGDAYVSIGAHERAEHAYSEAIRHAPFEPYAYLQLADLLDRMGRKEEAAEYRRQTAGFIPHRSLQIVEDVEAGANEIADLIRRYLDLA